MLAGRHVSLSFIAGLSSYDYLEKLAQAKIGERIVKHGGLVVYGNQAYWTSKKNTGQKIELWQTLKGLEIRKDGFTYAIVSDYWEIMSKKV